MIKTKTVGWMLSAAILVTACLAVAYLVLPGSPTSTANLHFDGFIILPPQSGGWPVSVMDYLTVYRRNLFVASIRPGAGIVTLTVERQTGVEHGSGGTII
jgi:hypothetical protein